jgi:HAD superfamily hydrolase (TIGR01509 family)
MELSPGESAIHLFDWDGTLADTMPAWMSVLEEQVKRRKLDLSLAQIHELGGNWNVISKYGLSPEDIEEFGLDARAASIERLLEAPLFHGALEVLCGLRDSGKKLGIVTSTHRETLDKSLAIHNLQSMFDVTVCGSESEYFKPHPWPVQEALRQLGYNGEPAIMWGDADRDLISAESAGIQSALFYPSHHAQYISLEDTAKDANPAIIIQSWDEMLNKLQ